MFTGQGIYGRPTICVTITTNSFRIAAFLDCRRNIWFSSYYCDCTIYGSQYDAWGGFVLSSNVNKSVAPKPVLIISSAYADGGLTIENFRRMLRCQDSRYGHERRLLLATDRFYSRSPRSAFDRIGPTIRHGRITIFPGTRATAMR